MAKGKVSVNEAMALIMSNDIVRPNRFSVEFNFPSFGFSQSMNDAVEAVEFPGLALGTVDFQSNSQPIYKVPYAKLPAQTCNITFRLSANLDQLDSLYKYIKFATPTSGQDYFVKYPSELWGDIKISMFNIGNVLLYELTLIRAILTNIDTAQLSFDDRDSYMKQTATFSYQEIDAKIPEKLN